MFLTDAQWPSFLAGLTAMFMPWRLSEVVHIQLLFAGWLPIVWLLIARNLFEDLRTRRFVALAAAWTALVFSSYYLAYISCFVTGIFIVGLLLTARVRWKSFAGVLLSLGAPLLLLVALSLPYLHARAQADIAPAKNALLTLWPALLFSSLKPPHILFPSLTLPWHGNYTIPWPLLGMAAFAAMTARRSRQAETDPIHVGSLVIALAAATVFAVVMALGNEVHIGNATIPLPSSWLRRVVPGFELMRAPLRWTLVLGVTLPVLAAVGYRQLSALVKRRAPRFGLPAAVVFTILLTLPFIPPALPVAASYPSSIADLELYEALAAVPNGPVLEIPWPQHPLSNAISSSEYMVGSTRHWKPLLNGYSGYNPRSYDFLVRVGSRLPAPSALDLLHKLTGLRWIVVHLDRLPENTRAMWSMAAMRGTLIPAYRSDTGLIYEVADASPTSAELQQRLFSSVITDTTITGVSRSALRVSREEGEIAATFPIVIRRYVDGWANESVPARIVNRSAAPWPGLDPHPAGLVNVRYTIRGTEGRFLEGISQINGDVPPDDALRTNLFVQGHLDEGDYTICLELVQSLDGELTNIGIAPLCGPARVVPSVSG